MWVSESDPHQSHVVCFLIYLLTILRFPSAAVAVDESSRNSKHTTTDGDTREHVSLTGGVGTAGGGDVAAALLDRLDGLISAGGADERDGTGAWWSCKITGEFFNRHVRDGGRCGEDEMKGVSWCTRGRRSRPCSGNVTILKLTTRSISVLGLL